MEEKENEHLQRFEESRLVSENYLAYISRQSEEQQEKTDVVSHSLDSVIEEVRAAGVVSALAAQESLQSHDKTFVILAAMSRAQDYLTQLVSDIKQNGGTSGNGGGSVLGSFFEGGATSGALTEMFSKVCKFAKSPKVLIGMIIAGGLIKSSSKIFEYDAKKKQKKISDSIMNNAITSSSSVREIAEGISTEQNNPRSYSPYLPTAEEAAETLSGTTSTQIDISPSVAVEYSPYTEYDETTQLYSEPNIAEMQPQSVQSAEQTSYGGTTEQHININMTNEFPGHIDLPEIRSVGEILAQQIKERLSSGTPVYSKNW